MTSSSPSSKQSLERSENGQPRFHGCSRIQEYEFLGKLGEGTFGEVSKARSKKTGAIVALKKILMHNEKDGFPITALREIKLLKQLDHINILKLEEMAVERPKDSKKKPSMFMVTPYMEHDLSGLLENPSVHFSEPQIKCYMIQLLEGLRYLHENKILHRDMKAANLLINNRGILQIADFGLARPYEDEPPKPGHGGGEATREYTCLVVTRWYRPPELLLQLRRYTTAIDMWGVGCVFGEMFKGKPILAGNSDLNQAQIIFDLVGSPTEENMPGWSELPGCEGVKEFASRAPTLPQVFRNQGPLAISLLSEFLKLDWRKRINAIDALKHPYFHSQPLPANPGDLPQFEDSHELDRRKFRGQKAALPPAPAGGSVGIGAQGEWGINGRPTSYDQRGGSRIPGAGGHHHQNGHGRRPPPPRSSNVPEWLVGSRKDDYPPPVADRPYNTHPRPPAPYELPPYNSRVPPGPPIDASYSRRPRDISLPPKPPPPADHGWQNQPPYRGDDRGDFRGDQRRDRVPPPPPPASSRLPHALQNAKVDTYIPDYSNGPDRDRAPPPRRDDYLPPRREDDYRRADVPPPIDDRLRYDDGGPSSRAPDTGMRGGSGGGYDRRRSRSPRIRDWDRPRDVDRYRR
jgi:serine/threonine-protein kinase BUR1